jgi:DNA-binding response OmpR family regulator
VSGSEPRGYPERARLRILLVDDDPSMARLVQETLAAHGFASAAHVTTGRAALDVAADADIVLLDHKLPDVTGLEVLEALRGRPEPPSVVLVTAHGNESLAARALRQGADDYLAKDAAFVDLLPQVLERVRRNRALREALAAAERDVVRAERLAAVVELTVTLHHEINNPLMAASAEVELLLRGAPDPRSREGLAAIKASLDRIRDILRRIRDLRDAPSTEYLAGLRMLDLGAGGGVREVHRGTAVLAIPEDLARVATLLLRTAGFTVVRAGTADELNRAVGSLDVTVVLVLAAAAAPADTLAGFRGAPDRRYRLVALAAGEAGRAAAEGSDHVMMLPFDPGTFVGEILAVLGPK